MNYASLVKAITTATTELQGRVASFADQALVIRNWLVGAWIVEFEQQGKDRAKYGERLLEALANDLTMREVKGLGDPRALRDCRVLYRAYPQIRGTASRELALPNLPEIEEDASRGKIRGTVSRELPPPLPAVELLRLSWSKLQELMRLEDPWQRAFYERECLVGHWSVRQLRRQIGSLLFERTGLSKNKKTVIERAHKQESRQTIADALRDPYILEFTGLVDRPEYSEHELETALLDHLQKFILELGRGFCFEARQFRMTEGRRHHRVDLVFYHRILLCHVVIDLKVRPFQPADAGQMNFYVNWFKAHMMSEGDNPPVGILLCSDRDGAEVEFATAGMDQKLFVSRYLVALPSAEKLRAFLEADRDQIESLTVPTTARKSPSKSKIKNRQS
jgi:predicted nuclease of restriction endonuclease-like (RecB) superfamily